MNKVAVAIVSPSGKIHRKQIGYQSRDRILEKNNYMCQICGGIFPKGQLRVDHIYPASRGGNNFDDNLQVLCHRCNSAKRQTDIKMPNLGIQLQFRLNRARGVLYPFPIKKRKTSRPAHD